MPVWMQPVLGHSQYMRRRLLFALAAFWFSAPAMAAPSDTSIASVWVQYVPGGGAEVRAIVRDAASGCPTLMTGNGTSVAPLTPRAAAAADFPLVCAAHYPAGAKDLRIGFPGDTGGFVADVPGPATGQLRGVDVRRAVPDIVADPQRILVLGDTGCRIKGRALQACNDPLAWPFAALAQAAARLKPDLIIHLGDYLYRESPCPIDFAGCAGSPWGDNWPAWNADFFTPAAPFLASAPIVFIRGNHEDCARSGSGFLRMLGPVAFDPSAACIDHLVPYAVPVGDQTVAVTDTAEGDDTHVDAAVVADFAKDFKAVALLARSAPGHMLWTASHRPIWGVISSDGMAVGGSLNLVEAAGNLGALGAVSLMLSGHIHSFEAINYNKVPPQIVAGHGGDNLDHTPSDLSLAVFQGGAGVAVTNGISIHGFGFLTMTRDANHRDWSIQLYDSDGTPTTLCLLKSGKVSCPTPITPPTQTLTPTVTPAPTPTPQ